MKLSIAVYKYNRNIDNVHIDTNDTMKHLKYCNMQTGYTLYMDELCVTLLVFLRSKKLL